MSLSPRRLLAPLAAGALLLLAMATSRADAVALADPNTGRPDQAVLVTAGSVAPADAGILAATGPGYLSPVTEAARPFTHALLRWEAVEPVSDTLGLELRVSPDGEAWSDWSPVLENPDLWIPADGEQVYWSQDIYAGEGVRFWQVRALLSAAPDGRMPELRRVEVNTVDARFGPAEPTAESARLGPAAVGRPPVVSRSAWGSPDGQGSRVSPVYYPVKHMVVHHTADSNSLSGTQQSWSDRVRAIWSFHTFTRGWGDIGYNYLVDPNGVVYEGRAGGDDAVAFHDTANYGSMGVVLIGTYATVDPRPAAVDSLVELLAWKAGQKGIDPLGRSFYYGCSRSSYCNPYNPGGIVENISGHRQVTPGHTSCPGDQALSRLPEVRQRVQDRLSGGTGGPPVDPLAAKLEVLGVRYDRQQVAAGQLLKVTFTVKNSGGVAIEGQAPEAARRPDVQASFDLADSYVYDEGECFLGAPGQATPAFPKEAGRFRVLLGPADPARLPACAGDAGGYPWRWGINGALAPGETRDVVGYLLLRTPGALALQAGAINEYVDYMARGVAGTTITVTNELQPPAPAAYDEALRPLAHVYRLGEVPDNLLARTGDATAVARGAYVGSFAWTGEARDWGEGGPLASAPDLVDRFLVEQTRSFTAPITGTYTFQIASDDGAWLWVNGQLVASHPGLHDALTPVTGTVELAAGRHILAYKMFERSGAASASYSVRGPGQEQFGPVADGLIAGSTERLGATFRRIDSLNLVADDLGGQGVARIRVATNDGVWREYEGAGADLGALEPGAHVVRYVAVDRAGNSSPERSLRVTVAPDLSVRTVYLPALMR